MTIPYSVTVLLGGGGLGRGMSFSRATPRVSPSAEDEREVSPKSMLTGGKAELIFIGLEFKAIRPLGVHTSPAAAPPSRSESERTSTLVPRTPAGSSSKNERHDHLFSFS